MEEKSHVLRGLVFGLFLSIPLWISMIGWMQLL